MDLDDELALNDDNEDDVVDDDDNGSGDEDQATEPPPDNEGDEAGDTHAEGLPEIEDEMANDDEDVLETGASP